MYMYNTCMNTVLLCHGACMRTAAYGSVFVCMSVCVLTAQRLLYQLVLHVAHIKLINVMHAILV